MENITIKNCVFFHASPHFPLSDVSPGSPMKGGRLVSEISLEEAATDDHVASYTALSKRGKWGPLLAFIGGTIDAVGHKREIPMGISLDFLKSITIGVIQSIFVELLDLYPNFRCSQRSFFVCNLCSKMCWEVGIKFEWLMFGHGPRPKQHRLLDSDSAQLDLLLVIFSFLSLNEIVNLR